MTITICDRCGEGREEFKIAGIQLVYSGTCVISADLCPSCWEELRAQVDLHIDKANKRQNLKKFPGNLS